VLASNIALNEGCWEGAWRDTLLNVYSHTFLVSSRQGATAGEAGVGARITCICAAAVEWIAKVGDRVHVDDMRG
jgi:hypothetical protein